MNRLLSPKDIFGIAFAIILTILILPQIANADTITCHFENYAGEQVKCSDRQPFTTNYPYLIEDKGTHYKITNDADVCKLPMKPWLDYSFTPNKIGMSATIPSIASVSDRLVRHNDSVYYLSITNMSRAVRKCGKMFWDERFTIMDNGTMTGEFDEEGIEIRNYSYLPENEAQFKVVNNQLRLYVYKQWFTQTAQFPITINTDSWILNSTAGWNGTFTQTNTDENESVMINWNHSTFEPYLTYLTMDRFNSTVIFDENITSGNNGTISGATDAVGWRNRSRSFDGTNDLILIPDSPELRFDAGTQDFSVAAWIKTSNTGKVLDKRDGAADGWQLVIPATSDRIRITVNAISATSGATGIVTDGSWHHVVGTVDRDGVATVYVDSVASGGTPAISGEVMDTTADLHIGTRSYTSGEYFNGSIDEVKIFNRTLSAAEVSALYNDSYYATGNFTTVKRDWNTQYATVNISYEGLVPTGTSINIYQNYSNDDTTWALELVQANSQPATNYTVANKARYGYYIFELNTSTPATPHISRMEIYEAIETNAPIITVDAPENITYNVANQVPLEVSADETIDTWIYNIGFGNVTFTPNTTILFIPNGTYQLFVWANDTSGNWGVNSTIYFTINVSPQGLQFGSLAVISLGGNGSAIDRWVDESGDVVEWLNVTTFLNTGSFIRTTTPIYRRYYHMSVGGFDPGASGATWTDPSGDTTAGWRLNAAGEILIAIIDVHRDWDEASDLSMDITFALNAAGNSGDTVDLKATLYYNGVGETSTKTQTVEVATTTDGTQYKVYGTTLLIDHDAPGNVVDRGDIISVVLNLETDTSEIDDIIMTGGSYFYNTTHIGIEAGDT